MIQHVAGEADGAPTLLSEAAALAVTADESVPILAVPLLASGAMVAIVLLLLEAAGPHDGPGWAGAQAAALDLQPVLARVVGDAVLRTGILTRIDPDLDRVIAEGRFHPVYQPIVHLASGEMVGFEALTRFDDGTRPDIWFAEAERVGRGSDLELVTLRAALEDSPPLPPGAYLSVNVSARLLGSTDLDDIVAMARARRRPLVLELTEHERVDDYARLEQRAADVRPDARLSVDDAGSGWASLHHVVILRPDYVKIDRSLVRDLEADAARQALLAGISRFVELVGGKAVAEGIERAEERDAVMASSIEFAQGFLLGRPEPAHHWA